MILLTYNLPRRKYPYFNEKNNHSHFLIRFKDSEIKFSNLTTKFKNIQLKEYINSEKDYSSYKSINYLANIQI